MTDLLSRYEHHISGVLSCFDRIIIWGSLPDIGYAEAATNWLFRTGVRICEYGNWAKERKERVYENAHKLAKQHNLTVDFLRRHELQRKEDLVAQRVAERGDHPGLVCILSAMESCSCYRYYRYGEGLWKLKPDDGKCTNFYFYFIDEHLGLCHFRVPAWAPFRVQFYCNGHSVLERSLKQHGVCFTMDDNTFVEVGDFKRAQALSDQLTGQMLHPILNRYARMFCPVGDEFPAGWHWTLRQVEYSTDVVFGKPDKLSFLYQCLVRQAIEVVRASDVAEFVGKRLTVQNEQDVSSNFSTRVEMTRIKHQFGPVSIKMYDKRGRVLRIETTCNDMSFFKHHREVVHRDGTSETKLAPLRKTIYSLEVARELMRESNRRYISFLSALEDYSSGDLRLDRISRPHCANKRNWSGYNFFSPVDRKLFEVMIAGQWNVGGFSARMLHASFPEKSSSWISRQIKRLRVHGLAKKIPSQIKYHLTAMGRTVLVAALALRQYLLVPIFNKPSST